MLSIFVVVAGLAAFAILKLCSSFSKQVLPFAYKPVETTEMIVDLWFGKLRENPSAQNGTIEISAERVIRDVFAPIQLYACIPLFLQLIL